MIFKKILNVTYLTAILFFSGCGSLKVVEPTKQNSNGTLALDYSQGVPKVVGTFSCTIVSTNGKRVTGTGTTENLAQNEALAKCRDQIVISFCKASNLKCQKN